MFINGAEVKSDPSKSLRHGGPVDRKIVVGRFYIDTPNYYSNMQVDELIYFDHVLTGNEILSIYNSA